MPIPINTNDQLPSFIAKPDMRFATTFLSLYNRRYAVKGESLMDKATGEIFTKRTADGRVVSFFQNKKYMYDICSKLFILLNNNSSFLYPRDSKTGYFTSVDYDSMSIFDDERIDILTNDIVIPNTDEETTTQFKFYLSTQTNGFFIRLTSRDSDKAIISFLTTEYNNLLRDYDGDDEEWVLEHDKLVNIEKYEDSDCTIEYTVKVYKGEEWKVYTCTDSIRVNEECCCYIPYVKMSQDFLDGYDSVLVTIKGIRFDKIRFLVNKLDQMSDDFKEAYKNLIYPDSKIFVDYFNIERFIDSSKDLYLRGNEFIVAFIDVPFVKRYVMKMAAIKNPGDMRISTVRPSDDEWATNTIWAERISDIYKGGNIKKFDTETDIDLFAEILFGGKFVSGNLTTDPTEEDNFLLIDESDSNILTAAQVDALVDDVVNYTLNRANNVVVRAENENNLRAATDAVNMNGVVLGTVTTEVTDSEEGDEP